VCVCACVEGFVPLTWTAVDVHFTHRQVCVGEWVCKYVYIYIHLHIPVNI